MTRSEQKAKELRIVQALLEALGTKYELVELAEPPDVVIRMDGQQVGIEVTEYHDPSLTSQGVTRRTVEAWWDRIRNSAVELRRKNAFLDGLHVYLRFEKLEIPSPKEIDDFVADVADFLEAHRSEISEEWIEFSVGTDKGLRRFVRSVRVKKANGYWSEWEWNHDVARIGASEPDFLGALSKKLSSSPISGFSELWLVVADGAKLSQVIAAFSVERLNSFVMLQARLEASPYSRVFLLDFELYEWAKNQGWRTLAKL